MKTTDEWRRLGKDDPYFAVAAHPGKRGRWEPDEFYRLGRDDWTDFLNHWQTYESGLAGTCVEIGCGAGRITQGLVDTFHRVVALDVSEDMMRLASAVVPRAEFRAVHGTSIPLEPSEADAVFSCHVLQHLESLSDVSGYMEECHRVLRPGGTVMLHLLLAGASDPLPRRVAREVRLRVVRQLGRNRGAHSRVRFYHADQVRSRLEAAGFSDVVLTEFRVRSNDGIHAFWFGRA